MHKVVTMVTATYDWLDWIKAFGPTAAAGLTAWAVLRNGQESAKVTLSAIDRKFSLETIELAKQARNIIAGEIRQVLTVYDTAGLDAYFTERIELLKAGNPTFVHHDYGARWFARHYDYLKENIGRLEDQVGLVMRFYYYFETYEENLVAVRKAVDEYNAAVTAAKIKDKPLEETFIKAYAAHLLDVHLTAYDHLYRGVCLGREILIGYLEKYPSMRIMENDTFKRPQHLRAYDRKGNVVAEPEFPMPSPVDLTTAGDQQ